MQLFAYRNTERSIHERRPIAAQSLENKQVVIDAKREAMRILTAAREEAERITNVARIEADSILSEAVTKAGKIVGMAGLEPGEGKQPVIEIIRVVARKHALSVETIKSQTRTIHVVEARHEAMGLVYKLRPDLSLPAIGKIFGRDHTSVLHAVRKLGIHRGGLPPKPQSVWSQRG